MDDFVYCMDYAVTDVVIAGVLKRLGQGRDRALQYLRENPQLTDEIEQVCILMPFSLFLMLFFPFFFVAGRVDWRGDKGWMG